MPVIDTNLLIRLEEGDETAKSVLQRLVDAGDPILLPAQAAAEYLTWVDDRVAELHNLRSAFHVVHTTDDLVLEVARLTAQARQKGAPKPHWQDAFIAAVAALEGTYVVTTNKRHFTQLGVPAWNYATETEPPK